MPGDTRTYPRHPLGDTSELRRHLERRRERLLEAREPWIRYCEEVAHELMPIRLPYIEDPDGILKSRDRNKHIVDTTGWQAVQTSSSGIVSSSMPSTSKWFELVVRGIFGEDRTHTLFLQESQERMRVTINASNVNQEAPIYAMDLIMFGTAAAIFLEDDEDTIRLDLLMTGEYCIAEDHRGRADTCYREFTMTVGQLEQEFGYDALEETTQRAWLEGRFDEVVQCVHAIEPDRDDLNPLGRFEDQPWRSVYYELGSNSQQVLDVRGYAKFPVLVTRWAKMSGSAYGHGRGMDALPHLVRLRKQIYAYAEALAYKVKPPVTIPRGVAPHEVKMLPGAKSSIPSGDKIETMWQVGLELNDLQEDIEKTRQDIRDVLGSSLVSSLRQISHQMTATEVDTRTTQDLMEFLPGIARLLQEWHDPLVDLTWDAMLSQDLLPPIPDDLPDQIDIEFVSPLARKQRADEVTAIVRTYSIAAEISKVRQDILDNLDPDAAIRHVAEVEGAPADVLKALDVMNAERQARERAALAEKQADAAQQGAELAEGLGRATQAVGPPAPVPSPAP